MKKAISVGALALSLCACSFQRWVESPPAFDLFNHDETKQNGPTVAQVVDHLQCELRKAAIAGLNAEPPMDMKVTQADIDANKDPPPPKTQKQLDDQKKTDPKEQQPELPSNDVRLLRAATYFHYVASATLTIQVVSAEGFNPSLTGVDPYDFNNPLNTHNVEAVLTGGVTASQNREIVVNFPIDFDKFAEDWRTATRKATLLQPVLDQAKKNAEAPRDSHPAEASQYRTLASVVQMELDDHKLRADRGLIDCTQQTGIRGDLGLLEVLQDGFFEERGANEKVYETNDATAAAVLSSLATPSLTTTSAPIASQLIFIITTSVGGGPIWTIKNFIGPNSTTGLINGSRMATDTLLISFAPSCQTPAQQAALADLTGPAPKPDLRPAVAQNYAPVLDLNDKPLFLPLPDHNIVNYRTVKAADGSVVKDQRGNSRGLQWPYAGNDPASHIPPGHLAKGQPEVLNYIRVAALPISEEKNGKIIQLPARLDYDAVMDPYWPNWITSTECPFKTEVPEPPPLPIPSDLSGSSDDVKERLDRALSDAIADVSHAENAALRARAPAKSEALDRSFGNNYSLPLLKLLPLQ